jgi:hypothetical protein
MTRISTAYDAYWFLLEHPKLNCREAVLDDTARERDFPLPRGERLRRVHDETPWEKKTYVLREFGAKREALPVNLSIFYAKVDKRGWQNDDQFLNLYPECWLEFGKIKQGVQDGHLSVINYHDIRLDCGAPTFDAALVKLARLVRKHYRDYKAPTWLVAQKGAVSNAGAKKRIKA